ncbi:MULTISPECIES: aldo/keto reductase [Haloarcula]|uniref:aldo/keto reductase n=1 Tax=Haloarcula TaxID=2237 RepID=UPI0023EC6DC6|nr:aldo/keto reductase [Halomicroarcula sp. XH51]
MDEIVGVNRTSVPKIGFGTYQMEGKECLQAVRTALETGYRHVDTAMAYDNESVIGDAIAESEVDREDVFLTTKVKGYREMLTYDRFLAEAEGSLDRLGTDYVDLLLVHWWQRDGDMEGVFRALDELVAEGKVRHIGVSNFSVELLERARDVAETPILTNQIEYHPYFTDIHGDTVNYCQEHDILVTAYSPLAEGRVVSDETFAEIGERHGKTAAQVTIRWLIQQDGVIAIPKSSTDRYIRENLDVFDFELSDAEMQTITDARGSFRYRFLDKQGGPIHTMRGVVGSRMPEPMRKAALSIGSAALKSIR